ncbi:MAG: hypothetical protein ABI253_03010 [Mycobacterium sp.]
MADTTDTGSMPMTEPHAAPIFDTGPHPTPLPGPVPAMDEPVIVDEPSREPGPDKYPSKSRSSPATSVLVAGQHRFLKWWQLALVLVGVWIPAAGIGLGLFSWWYSLGDKTPAVFVVVVYAAACIVAGLIVAMVGEKPLVSAVAIALMSAVFASAIAAAPLYGHYFCQHVSRCVGGIIPY